MFIQNTRNQDYYGEMVGQTIIWKYSSHLYQIIVYTWKLTNLTNVHEDCFKSNETMNDIANCFGISGWNDNNAD